MQHLSTRRLVALATLAVLTLGACSSSETAGSELPAGADTTLANPAASASTTTSAPVAREASSTVPAQDAAVTTTTALSPTGAVSRDDLVRFIAATETVLQGTPNQGVVYDAPEIYIAIAQAACARFTAGDSFDAVANDLLVQLASANPADDKKLVGAILGAATQTICPEHAGLI